MIFTDILNTLFLIRHCSLITIRYGILLSCVEKTTSLTQQYTTCNDSNRAKKNSVYMGQLRTGDQHMCKWSANHEGLLLKDSGRKDYVSSYVNG